MYTILLTLHSLVRWLVLAALFISLYRAYRGWISDRTFSAVDNAIRHWTATIAHIQLLLGLSLYFSSPITGYFMHHFKAAVREREIRFFGMEHSSMMVIAIVLLTIGSAMAKRRQGDREKFKTMAIWYSLALVVILASIPWPFSPMATRPLFRPF